MKKILYIFLILLFACSYSIGATLVYDIDFDDQTRGVLNDGQGTYTFQSPGRDGTGYAFYQRESDPNDTTLRADVNSTWAYDAFYVEYWVKYPTFEIVATDNSLCTGYKTPYTCCSGAGTGNCPGDIGHKMFYPHWNGTSSYVHYGLTNDHTMYYSAKADGVMVDASNWIGIPDIIDNAWHKLGWYVNFSTGQVKFFVDGSLESNDTYGAVWTNKKIYYFAGPSIDQNEVTEFSRLIDDYTIWGCSSSDTDCADGNPSGGPITDTYPPTVTFNQPTSGQTGVSTTGDIKFYVLDGQGNLDPLLDNHSLFYFTITVP